MIVRKGSRWLCIKDVRMNVDWEWIAYKKGKVYISEHDFSITDEQGSKEHRWDENVRSYFKFLPRNKGFTARKLQSEEPA